MSSTILLDRKETAHTESRDGMGNGLAWLTLALILAGGLYVRLTNLGMNNFWSDELYHVLAAKSLLTVGEPILPGGFLYERCLHYTYLIAGMFRIFGESEAVARVPSVFY